MSPPSPDPTDKDRKHRRRSDYPFFLSYRTRWSDNDQYARVNNAIYYHLFDAIVNTYLIQHCGLAPTSSTSSTGLARYAPSADADAGLESESNFEVAGGDEDQIGLVVSSFCEFFSPLSFPDVLDLGLRVAHLGKSSVTYEVGVFRASGGHGDMPAAVGGYTHVFVDKRSRTSMAMNPRTRAGLEKLVVVTQPKL